MKAQASEWTRGWGTHQAPPAQVERDRIELGGQVAQDLYFQQGAWWDPDA